MEKQYFELTRMIERLHRQFIDVLKAELNRTGVRDINGVQALLLTNIGHQQISIRDLVERGVEPGPVIGEILRELEELQLSGEIITREAALEWLDRRVTPHV